MGARQARAAQRPALAGRVTAFASAVVHLLDPDGTIRCRGLTLVKPGRTLADNPPRVTIYPEEASCEICRVAWLKDPRVA